MEKLQAMWFRLGHVAERARGDTDKSPTREDPEGRQWALAFGFCRTGNGELGEDVKGGSGAV